MHFIIDSFQVYPFISSKSIFKKLFLESAKNGLESYAFTFSKSASLSFVTLLLSNA